MSREWNGGTCPATDGADHAWTPVQFVSPYPGGENSDTARVYFVCEPCLAHTYALTEWVGYTIGDGTDYTS